MKHIFKFIGIILISMMTLCISACGEEKEENSNAPIIVGTWKYSWEDGYCLLQINKDMTAIYNEWDDGEWDSKDEKYNYVYDETNNIIYFYDFYTGKLWEECQIVGITKTEMRTLDFLDGGILVWKRQ